MLYIYAPRVYISFCLYIYLRGLAGGTLLRTPVEYITPWNRLDVFRDKGVGNDNDSENDLNPKP